MQTNANRRQTLIDDGHTVTVNKVFAGDRFYVLSIGPSEAHLLYSGTFDTSANPVYGQNQRILVTFDGETGSRSRPTDVLGIHDSSAGLVCMNSLDPLQGDFVDLRPARQRTAHQASTSADGAGVMA